ncbi:MAG: hypothetical protein KIT84_03225 [Labilithrix sp.]|nr:hypothetical protein [Labilithrix sp.]MCW5809994.1 hypothetical protein [Labilithrix sp.]
MDPPAPPPSHYEEPPYVYAPSDIRPRQAREIELCEQASGFDWMYTGAFALSFVGSVYLNIKHLKHMSPAPVRFIGPTLVGFTWGGFLGGGYLSLPKCDPLYAPGPGPDGNVRTTWPMALAIAMLAGVSAPIMDYNFLGPVKPFWEVAERSARVFIAGGFGVLGSLFPYLVPPRTWSAAKEIEKMRIEGYRDGAILSYRVIF